MMRQNTNDLFRFESALQLRNSRIPNYIYL